MRVLTLPCALLCVTFGFSFAQAQRQVNPIGQGMFRLTGTVFDENQAVVLGTQITAVNGSGKEVVTTTGEYGTYEMDLPLGTYALTFEGPPGFRTSKIANLKQHRSKLVILNVKLEVGRCSDCNGALYGDRWDDFTTIRGTVYDRFGNGLSLVKVRFVGLDGSERFMITGAEGRYELGLPVFPNDTYRVSAESHGFRSFRIDRYRLPVMEHGKINLDFVLETVICDKCPDAESVGDF